MQARTDKELIEAYADSGDEPFDRAQGEAAFAELVSRYRSLVYRTCFRLLRDAHEAEDAAQAAFVVLARKAGKLRQEGRLNGWLHRVARNVSLYALERRVDRERQRQRMALWQENIGAKGEDRAETEVILEQLDKHLDCLSPVLREAVILRHLRGYSEKDAAAMAGCAVSAMKWRTSEGLAKLRSRLAKRGIAVGATALAAVLESEAQATIPETLLSSTVTAVKAYAAGGALPGVVLGTQTGATDLPGVALGAKTGAVSANVVVLTKGVLNMMFWNGVKIGVAVAVGVAAVAGGGVAAVRAVGEKEPSSTGLSRNDIAQRGTNTVIVTPRGADARPAFRELERLGGVRVVMLGVNRNLLVPVELRFTPVEGRRLIEVVVATHGLKVAWRQEGKYAVIYPGAPDDEIELARKDLDGPDVVSRRRGAWRAGWLRDIRVVPLLVKAAKDQDTETAREALVGLRRMNWDAVLLLDKTAFDLLPAELDSPARWVRSGAVHALGNMDGENAPALIEKALDDKDARVRENAVYALGNLGGEKSLALIEKTLDDKDASVRTEAVGALGRVGGEKALALIEKTLADKEGGVRHAAVFAFDNVGGEKALALLEKALADNDTDVRTEAVYALGSIGGEKALALSEKAFADKDADVRMGAVYAFGNVGGEKALALIEKALGDEYACVRTEAVRALGNVGGEKALALIEKALHDTDTNVRQAAVSALGNVGGEKALALLEKAFDGRDAEMRRAAVSSLLAVSEEKALVLIEKTLDDTDTNVRQAAVIALGRVGGEKALALIEKALHDKDTRVRENAVYALGNVNRHKVRDLLLGRLTSEEDHRVLEAIRNSLQEYSRGDPVVEKALSKVNAKLSIKKLRAERQP